MHIRVTIYPRCVARTLENFDVWDTSFRRRDSTSKIRRPQSHYIFGTLAPLSHPPPNAVPYAYTRWRGIADYVKRGDLLTSSVAAITGMP